MVKYSELTEEKKKKYNASRKGLAVLIRLSPDEIRQLEEEANKAGLTKNAYVKNLVRSKIAAPRPS